MNAVHIKKMKYLVFKYLLIALSFGIGQAKYALRQGCQYYYQSPGKGVHLNGVKCTYANLGSVPSDFPSNINYLEIESDNIKRLNSSSLTKYPGLKYLSIKHVGVQYIEEETFLALTKLLHLDLSGNAITQLPMLPSSLETLRLNSMPNSSEMFSDSARTHERMMRVKSSLKTLVMQNNALEFVPTFVRELRRLKCLVVSTNKIKRLTVDDVAPLCNLEELDFTYNEISAVERYMCDCMDLKKWISEERTIRIYGLTCPPSAMSKEQCDDKFGEDLVPRVPEYYECRIMTFLTDYWSYLVCGMVVCSVFVAFYVYFHFNSNRRKMKPMGSDFSEDDECSREEMIAEEEVPLKEMVN